MEIIRYINGEKLNRNPGDYVVDCDVILETIARVNQRRKNQPPQQRPVNFTLRHSGGKSVETS